MKSYPLTVDTTNAIRMKPESTDRQSEAVSTSIKSTEITASDATTTTLFNDNDGWDDIQFTPKNRRRLISSENEQRLKEIVLGMCAALIVFLFILTVLCASRRDPLDQKTVQNAHNEVGNVLLNEVICVSGHNQS